MAERFVFEWTAPMPPTPMGRRPDNPVETELVARTLAGLESRKYKNTGQAARAVARDHPEAKQNYDEIVERLRKRIGRKIGRTA